MAEAKAFKMIPHCTKDTIQYEMDELVMCKDCKKRETVYCPFYWRYKGAKYGDWFCADGERKCESD